MVGGDINFTHQIVGGVVFHYGSPNVKNDLGKITADDSMIGAYMKLPIYWQITVNAMIAYGMQQYTYKGDGGKVKFDGDTIFGSLEFSRPFAAMPKLNLTPVVGIDFQGIGMDDLTVKLPLSGDYDVPMKPDGLDTVMVRVGLHGECFALRARAQYIRQVSGDDYMVSAATLRANTTNVRSVQWGKDWVNVGLGYDFVQMKNFRLSADYDFDISKNTSSHLGSVKATLAW
jgi:outer membrane autotransporter protein